MEVLEWGTAKEGPKPRSDIVKRFEGEAQGRSVLGVVENRQLSAALRARLDEHEHTDLPRTTLAVSSGPAPNADLLARLLNVERSVAAIETALLPVNKSSVHELLNESEAILQRIQDEDANKRISAALLKLSQLLSAVEKGQDIAQIESDTELLESSLSAFHDIQALSHTLTALRKDLGSLYQCKHSWPSLKAATATTTDGPPSSHNMWDPNAFEVLEARISHAEQLMRQRGVHLLDTLDAFEVQLSTAERLLLRDEN